MQLNHGIELSSDGKILFASSSTDVFAYDYDADKGTASNPRSIINGMDQGGHPTRTLLIPRLNSNLLLVSRGSDPNLDMDTVRIESGKSQIRVFNLTQILKGSGPAPYSSGEVLGWGLRNSVGVGEDPTTGFIVSRTQSQTRMRCAHRLIRQLVVS